MPTFDFDIEIDEILYECSKREKQELADKLYQDGYIAKPLRKHKDNTATGALFDAKVSTLIGNSWRLDKEDEETIMRIANKIIN